MTDYQPTTAKPASLTETNDASLKDKATDAAQAAKQVGPDVVQTAADKATDVAHETGKQARDLLGEARDQVRLQARTQHRAVVGKLRLLGDELGSMTAGAQQPGVATEVVSQARERVHEIANWLDGHEPGDLLEEIRSFARRQPGAFLLGAAMAGVLAGRLTRGVVAVHSEDDGAGPRSSEPTPSFGGATAQPAAARPGAAPPAAAPPAAAPLSGYPLGEGEVFEAAVPAADIAGREYGAVNTDAGGWR
jgi:hypothetical protein